MDIGDIERIAQFLVPTSLSVWMQRYGRAGRDGRAATAILLVEASVYQLETKSDKTQRGKKRLSESDMADDEEPNLRSNDDQIISVSELDERTANFSGNSNDDDGMDEAEEEQGDVGQVQTEAVLDKDGKVVYKKKVERGMREWIDAGEQCRRDVADRYFVNPQRRDGLFNTLDCSVH